VHQPPARRPGAANRPDKLALRVASAHPSRTHPRRDRPLGERGRSRAEDHRESFATCPAGRARGADRKLGTALARVLTPRLTVTERVVRGLLLVSLTAGTFATLGAVTSYQRLLPGVLFLVGAALSWRIKRSLQSRMLNLVVVSAWTALLVLSFVRFAADPILPITSGVAIAVAFTVGSLAVFAAQALLADVPAEVAAGRIRCALLAPAVFLVVNLVLYVAGISLPGSNASDITVNNGDSELLALIGIHGTRSSLPLVPGFNGSGAIAAIAVVTGWFLGRRLPRSFTRAFARLSVALGLVVILMVDSRGPLLWSILVIALIQVLAGQSKRVIAAVPLILPFGTTLVLAAVNALSGASSVLSRQRGDFTNATGRRQVWEVIQNYLTSSPHAVDLIGYGAYGQVTSGVGYRYAYLFNAASPEFSSAHNVALQTVLDTGYVGLATLIAVYVVSVFAALTTYQFTAAPEPLAAAAAIICLVLLGTDEAIPSGLTLPTLLAATMIVFASIRRPGKGPRDHTSVAGQRETAPG